MESNLTPTNIRNIDNNRNTQKLNRSYQTLEPKKLFKNEIPNLHNQSFLTRKIILKKNEGTNK